MGDIARDRRTVLFVSHNLGAVRSLCTRALVLGSGAVQFDGAVGEAIANYLSSSAARGEQDGQVSFSPAGLAFDDLKLVSVRLTNEAGEVRALYDATESIAIEIEYELTAPMRGARAVLAIATQEGELAFQSAGQLAREGTQLPGRYKTSCTIPGALLNCRMYVVEIGFDIPGVRTLAPRRPYLSFIVGGGGTDAGTAFPESWPGVVSPSLRWNTVRT
jgi:lipopolysaccharide transport system ATP-binding protein